MTERNQKHRWEIDPIVAPDDKRNTSVLVVIRNGEKVVHSKTVFKYSQTLLKRNPNRRYELPYFKGRVFAAEIGAEIRCRVLDWRARRA